LETCHLLALLKQEVDSKLKALVAATTLTPVIEPLEEIIAQLWLVMRDLMLV
jgi:hypothetical protein